MNGSDERVDLKPLDPGSRDPGFWIRFHGKVMNLAWDELSQRRMAHEWTVPEVVFQWRKALVPLTLLAAALAGIVLIDGEEEAYAMAPLALEEVLVEGWDGDPIPTVLGRTTELDEVAFLMEAGGFTP